MSGNTKLVSIVGFPRSGTTWLYKFFRTHDGIFTPFIKEMNYFAEQAGLLTEFQINNRRQIFEDMKARLAARGMPLHAHGLEREERGKMNSDADYLRFYQSRAANRPFLDISPTYSAMDVDGFARMADACPEAKIILLLRDKADHFWSSLNHRRKNLNPDITPLDHFAQIQKNGPELNRATAVAKDYKATYGRIVQVFDPARVLCLFTEDLFDPTRQQGAVDRICDFSGIARQQVGTFEFSDNRGVYDAMPDDIRKYAIDQGREDYSWALALMGRLPDRWHHNYVDVVGRKVASAPRSS